MDPRAVRSIVANADAKAVDAKHCRLGYFTRKYDTGTSQIVHFNNRGRRFRHRPATTMITQTQYRNWLEGSKGT